MAHAIVLARSRQLPAQDTPAFAAVAERFRRAGELDRAVALCRDGLKKFPNHLSARVTLGWALLDLGKYEEARTELQLVLKRAPDNLAAIRGLAQLHDHPRVEDADEVGYVHGHSSWMSDESEVDPVLEPPPAVVEVPPTVAAFAAAELDARPGAVVDPLAEFHLQSDEPALDEAGAAASSDTVNADLFALEAELAVGTQSLLASTAAFRDPDLLAYEAALPMSEWPEPERPTPGVEFAAERQAVEIPVESAVSVEPTVEPSLTFEPRLEPPAAVESATEAPLTFESAVEESTPGVGLSAAPPATVEIPVEPPVSVEPAIETSRTFESLLEPAATFESAGEPALTFEAVADVPIEDPVQSPVTLESATESALTFESVADATIEEPIPEVVSVVSHVQTAPAPPADAGEVLDLELDDILDDTDLSVEFDPPAEPEIEAVFAPMHARSVLIRPANPTVWALQRLLRRVETLRS